MPSTKPTFASDFRTFFLRGLVVLLPTVLTLWLLVAAYQFVENKIAQPINAGIRRVVIFAAPRVLANDDLPRWFVVTGEQVAESRRERERLGQLVPSDDALRDQIRATNFREWWEARWRFRVIGLIVAVVLFYVAGVVLGGFLGRRLYARFERSLTRIPIFKQIYPSMKQVVDFIFGQRQIAFNRVVLVEYPRRGMWAVGLVTGPSIRGADAIIGAESITVFIPSSPTPFTGYTVNVPRQDVRDVPISIDEAMKYLVSGGVLSATGDRATHDAAGKVSAPPAPTEIIQAMSGAQSARAQLPHRHAEDAADQAPETSGPGLANAPGGAKMNR